VDKSGKFESDTTFGNQYVNAIGDFLQSGDDYYFFCMDAAQQTAQLVKVTLSGTSLSAAINPVGNGITYPAAAGAEGNNFLLLSYDHEDKLMLVSRLNPSGDVIGNPQAFDIGQGDNVEEPIIKHFLRTGTRFPFKVGVVSSGLYFFNGFTNYTFSLVFTNLSGGISGVVNGQLDDGGFSAVYPLGGSKFAASRFNFGDNYFLPNVILSTNTSTSADELGGNTLPELIKNAPVRIMKAQVNGQSMILYASDTQSRQIGLFFYDEATGEFISSRYFGFSNPFEVANLLQTADGGLAICGTTYLAGRFPRTCVIKISKEELNNQSK
jgi:hypothetical protein